jgi:hypothetical protein
VLIAIVNRKKAGAGLIELKEHAIIVVIVLEGDIGAK